MIPESLFHEEKSLNLSSTEVKEVISISSVLSGHAGVNFVVLKIKNSSGKVISQNVYWLSNDGEYKPMVDMQKTSIKAEIVTSARSKSERTWTIKLSNTTNKLAFFIRPQLISDGEEVLPSFWSSNYFTLAPGETKTTVVSCPNTILAGKTPLIRISGWNVNRQELVINR